MIAVKDWDFIKKTHQLARKSGVLGQEAFAAILVKNEKIVVQATDQFIAYGDPTAHAELVVISEYCRKEQIISLEGFTLFTSTELCVMCSGAIHWAKISRVVFSVSQKGLQSISGVRLKPS